MTLPTEWQSGINTRGGTDDWTFDVAESLHMASTTPLFLSLPIDIKRNLLWYSFSFSIPVAAFGGFDQTDPMELRPVATLNATDTTLNAYEDARFSFFPQPGVLGTSMLVLDSFGPAHDPALYTYHYSLPEPLDVRGQRHYPAGPSMPEVTCNLSIEEPVAFMGFGAGVTFQTTCYLRTLYQQAL